MNNVNAHRVGLAFGGSLGILHATWALMVLVGVAQGFMDWIFSLHFLNFQYSVDPFSWVNAIALIIVTSLIGYIMGNIFGWLWNLAHRTSHGQ